MTKVRTDDDSGYFSRLGRVISEGILDYKVEYQSGYRKLKDFGIIVGRVDINDLTDELSPADRAKFSLPLSAVKKVARLHCAVRVRQMLLNHFTMCATKLLVAALLLKPLSSPPRFRKGPFWLWRRQSVSPLQSHKDYSRKEI